MKINILKSNIRNFLYLLAFILILSLALHIVANQKESSNDQNLPNTGHVMPKNNVEFIEGMIPHHKEAIGTSKIILSKSENEKLKQFAKDVINLQTKEINQMKSWFLELEKEKYVESGEYIPMMRNLENLSENELNKVYTEDMIFHHKGAIMMAKYILSQKSIDSRIENLAKNIIDKQSEEIDYLSELLNSFDK